LKVQLSHPHWGRIFLTGLLVVILVIIINTVLIPLAFLIWPQSYLQLNVVRFVSWSTFVLQFLLTVGGGVWIAHKVERDVPLQGLLMGLVIALIFLPFSFSSVLPALYVPLSFILTVVAGWLGGVLGSRGR
jgi:hypothetical protein